MKNERDNKEWLNEYPLLKQVNPVNAFTVPANYFYEMEGRIMEEIRLLQFKNLNPGEGFTVPQDYFDHLSQNIQSRVAIDEVLNNDKGFAVPANYFDDLTQNIQSRIAIDEILNSKQDFTVPENYFEDLTHHIHSRIAIDEILSTDQGFAIPENYFEDLSQNIQGRIAIEELINTEQGFTVPESYFAGLENRILQNTTGAEPAKQQVIVRRLWSTAIFKYATAACFSLFVGAAILMSEFNDKAIHDRSDVHKALSKVSNSDIESYLELTGESSAVMENSDANSLSNLPTEDTNKGNLN